MAGRGDTTAHDGSLISQCQQHVSRGDELQDKGELAEAEVEYRRALGLAEPDSSIKARMYVKIGRLREVADDLAEAKRLLQEALGVYDQYPCADELLEAVSFMGFIEFRMGLLEQAEATYRRALVLGERLEQWSQIGEILCNLGILYLECGAFEKAKSQFRLAWDNFRRIGDKWGMACQRGCLGNLHLRLGDLNQAEVWYKESLGFAEEAGRLGGAGPYYEGLADVLWQRGRLGEAAGLYEKAIGTYWDVGHGLNATAARQRYALVLASQKRYGESCEQLEKSREFYDSRGKTGRVADIDIHLGDVYFAAGNMEAAEQMFADSLVLFKGLGDKEREGDLYEKLGIVAYEKGQYVQTLAFWTMAVAILRKDGKTKKARYIEEEIGRLRGLR